MAQFGESLMVVNVPRGQSGITPEECKHVGFPKTSETKKKQNQTDFANDNFHVCSNHSEHERSPKNICPTEYANDRRMDHIWFFSSIILNTHTT